MASEHQPRKHRLINPEASAALLRRLVSAWDADDLPTIQAAIEEARRLTGSRPYREAGKEV